MKTKLILCAMISMSSPAFSIPVGDESFVKYGCPQVFNEIGQKFLADNSGLLSSFALAHDGYFVTFEPSAFTLCGLSDLEQGSYDLTRKAKYCAANGDSVTLLTNGETFCTGETVVGLYKIDTAD